MPNRDGTGPRDGRGQGKGRASGKAIRIVKSL